MMNKLMKTTAASALAAAVLVGGAASASARGLDDSHTVVNVADRAGALRGNIGLDIYYPNYTRAYSVSIPTGASFNGPDAQGAYATKVQAGGGYCIWEQVYSRPTGSTGDHTRYDGEKTYGKNERAGTWFSLLGYNYSYSALTQYEDRDYWSTLRIYAC